MPKIPKVNSKLSEAYAYEKSKPVSKQNPVDKLQAKKLDNYPGSGKISQVTLDEVVIVGNKPVATEAIENKSKGKKQFDGSKFQNVLRYAGDALEFTKKDVKNYLQDVSPEYQGEVAIEKNTMFYVLVAMLFAYILFGNSKNMKF